MALALRRGEEGSLTGPAAAAAAAASRRHRQREGEEADCGRAAGPQVTGPPPLLAPLEEGAALRRLHVLRIDFHVSLIFLAIEAWRMGRRPRAWSGPRPMPSEGISSTPAKTAGQRRVLLRGSGQRLSVASIEMLARGRAVRRCQFRIQTMKVGLSRCY